MKNIQQHIRSTVRQNLRPEFTDRVLRSVRSQRASDPSWWRPLLALSAALGACSALLALSPVAVSPANLQLNAGWENIVAAANLVRFHL